MFIVLLLFLTRSVKNFHSYLAVISKNLFFLNKKRNFLSFLKTSFSLLIVFQLVVHPYVSATPIKNEENLAIAHKFNEENVESLREFIFNNKSNGQDFVNHPLDVFSLLGQEVTSSKKKSELTEKIKNQTDRQTLLSDQMGEEELLNVYLEKDRERLEKEKDQFDQNQKREIREYNEYLTHLSKEEKTSEIILSDIERKQNQNNKALSRLNSKLATETARTSRRIVLPKNIFVEVLEGKELKAVLSHQERLPIAKQMLDEKSKARFVGSSFNSHQTPTEKTNLSFQLTYHNQKIHNFPQSLKWIAFFGNYLVFLDPTKVSDEKAFLSFIDLDYFKKAISKTALPLFHIPVHFKGALSKESIVSPNNLEVKADKLIIGETVISRDQMDYLSKLQQLNFNATVSLVDPANAKISQEYLKEIIDSFEKLLSQKSKVLENSEAKQINLNTKEWVLKILENRRKIGSSENKSGNYGVLDKTEINLTIESPNSELTSQFTQNLKEDKNFQKSVKAVHEEVIREQGFLRRKIAFLNQLTRPQPLGVPKIEKALGLIANSVIKKDTVKNRFLKFKEALSQFLHPNSNRFLTASVLVGAGLVASPGTAHYFVTALDTMQTWSLNWLELVSVTSKSSFTWADSEGLYKAYFEGNKPLYLMKGLVALFTVGLAFIGSIHLGVNFYDTVKHIRSKKEADHQKEVRGLFSTLKKHRNTFINYMEQNRSDFLQNLSNAEKRKLGIDLHFKMGLGNTESRQLMKTTSNVKSLYEALDSNKDLSLEIKTKNSKEQTLIINLKSETSQFKNQNLTEDQIALSISDSKQNIERVFTVSDGNLKSLLTEKGEIDHSLSMEINLSREGLNINGVLNNADFSQAQEDRLEKILTEIKEESGKHKSMKSDLTPKKITSLKQAMSQLALGYSSWAKTFRAMGLGWNWFFLVRSLYIKPSSLFRMLYYSKYFTTTYTEKHTATTFNGGSQNRLSRLRTVLSASKQTQKSKKESFLAIKDFENKIIAIERQFLEEATAQAYLELAKQSTEQPEEIANLAKGPSVLKYNDIKNKKLRLFYGIYKSELFQESMKDYLSELTNTKNLSDVSLKNKQFVQFLNGEGTLPTKLNPEEVRKRVQRVAKEQNLAQRSQSAVDNFAKGLLKRFSIKNQQSSKNALDPSRNLQMERVNIATRMLNDPESLARATRQQLTSFIIDTPISIFFTFLILAGVEQGILKPVHEQFIGDEALFHLSRYALWTGFFSGIVIDTLAGVWMKVQMDSRLEQSQGFDIIPSRRDVKKKLGFLRWLKKQYLSEDNSLWTNYKFGWKIIIANFPAALVTFSILHFATLGRFDLEAFFSVYLMTLFPILALNLKLENTFEKAANFSLKDFIKKGFDFNGKDAHFLSHPDVIAEKIRLSQALRRKYNLWLALLYGNPVGNIEQIFVNTHTSIGSRAFARMFFAGSLPTEYWVSFMDFLENKSILSSDFAESCKKIFTNKRTDL